MHHSRSVTCGGRASPEETVVVVGAGIVGASVAYRAARTGAAVTLVDAGEPGGGVTADSFAWVGGPGTRTGPAATLRRSAIAEYRRLEAELPGLRLIRSGSLSWGTAGDPPTAGTGQEIIDADAVARLEPALRQPPEQAVWAADDGAVDPLAVTEQLIAGASEHGARVHRNTRVTAVLRGATGRIAGIETTAGVLPGTTVVLAAGAATAVLGETLGLRIPVEPSPATLIRLRAPAGLVRTVLSTPDVDLRQVGADRLIAAADSPRLALDAVRSTFRGAADVELLGAQTRDRPMPADGEPIIGPVAQAPGLYVTALHSAVTLAPVVGRLVARELMHGVADPLLAGCRLERF